MKKYLFATTAAATMIAGGSAFAQGITLFGDARLGLGYNVDTAGGRIVSDTVTVNTPARVNPDFDPSQAVTPANSPVLGAETGAIENADADEIRAISRVRFGVRMTGETETGITFGATIRADNAAGGTLGTAGNVFVSGAFGTLTYGDTASAHQQHVGDLPAVGLTALGDVNEITYLGNREGAGNRPTVRYDFDVAGFGVSLGADNELEEYGIGASFSPNFGGGNFSIGAGYYDTDEASEWTVGATGGFAGYTGNITYVDRSDDDDLSLLLGIGVGTTLADIGLNAYWQERFGDGTDLFDGDSAYGVGATFALGTGASLRGGYVRTFEGVNAADFGINLTF